MNYHIFHPSFQQHIQFDPEKTRQKVESNFKMIIFPVNSKKKEVFFSLSVFSENFRYFDLK